VARNEAADALVLLTDGHDFELVNPAKTGATARNRQTPIYAVPLASRARCGRLARIASYQPYCYVKQRARLRVALRLIGCDSRT